MLRGISEPPLAQAASEIVAITRTIGGSVQHASLNFIGFLHRFETFRQAAGPFAGAAVPCEEQKDGDRQDAAGDGPARPARPGQAD